MFFSNGPPGGPKSAGPVTYRHLLSGSAQNVYNPLRVVAHLDIDGAYAQFEQVRLGLPDDVPLICAQWDSIIAVNYPARAYGIKRMTTIVDAKKACPHLYVQHVPTYREGESEAGYWDEVDRQTQKVSLDPYRRESLKILAIFREMAPKAELEKASIDEAFLDLTPMVLEELQRRFPYLASVPEDAPDGLESPLPPPPPVDWTNAGNLFPNKVKIEGQDEENEEEDGPDTWEDWALCIGAQITAATREEVRSRLHYTCSAGIGHNKTLAKLCSAWKKPNNQTVLRNSAVPAFLGPMDFTDIRFLGGKLGHAIAEEFGAKTVNDLLPITLDELQAKFGEESIWVYNVLRGIDHTEVKEKLSVKSMLASKNTIPAVTSTAGGYHWLSVLAGELAVRLRESREVTPGLWPKTVVLSTRSALAANPWQHRTVQMPFPFTRHLDADYIAKYGRRLWDDSIGKQERIKLTNISLQFTGLAKLEAGQRGIEGFFSKGTAKKEDGSGSESRGVKEEEAAEAKTEGAQSDGKRDGLKRERSASSVPETAHRRPKAPKGIESFLSRPSSTPTTPVTVESDSASASGSATPVLPVAGPSDNTKPAEPNPEPKHELEPEGDGDETTWTCPKCLERFALPDHVPAAEAGDWNRASRQEHADFHFALSLQEGGSPPRRPPSTASSSSTSRPKKKKGHADIKSFFAAKK